MAKTEERARLLDLVTGVLELTRDGNRDIDEVIEVFQIIKNKRNFAEILLAKKEKKALGEFYKVSVSYCMSLADMIAAGKYDWVNSDINDKHFQIGRHGHEEVEIQLVHFNRFISSEDAIRELDKMGLRPANLAELLAFGAKYPDEQRKYTVVALGSVWQSALGYRHVPYLWDDADERYLYLDWFGLDWDARCRFAAVRK